MNNVYLAAPFFDDAQKQRIEQVKAALQANPTINSDGIFIPEEHQFEEEPFGSRAWQQYVYASDMRQVHRADVLVAILDYDMTSATNEPDSGTMFEVGAAVAEKTPVLIVQFDADKDLNLMISQGLTAYFDASKDGLAELATYNCDDLRSKPANRPVF
ncbi:nucleoside 2-deoxyribosyltransferase [Lactiplantibacillus garii]|uniref:Nucleoside 2-deoxyribosyltransferase n=1 Tax=Lactiplantibacillus garii TaxID=2306423 RepID=A0A426D860_9LACO|nr:nucleoside 2-deoxyribosyltransferase [Lactiplantibacillus garii]RRK10741.1 nucleoside 2-deoxyribosyltransferase [Lactiplantibacillus garii]